MFKGGKAVFLLMVLILGPTGLSQAACEMNKIASLPVTRHGSSIFVPVKIEGQELLFLIDTASRHSWMLHAGADVLGKKVLLTTGGRQHDEIHFMTTRVGEASIGLWGKKDFDIDVRDGPVNFGLPRAVGVLGLDVLSGFDVEFDVKGAQVNLFVPQGCEAANLAYWSDSYNAVDMVRLSNSPEIFALAKVNGQDLIAGFRSTITYSGLFQDAAERVGVKPESPGVIRVAEVAVAAGQTMTVWRASFDSFSLDQEVIKPAVLSFNGRVIKDRGGLRVTGERVARGGETYDMTIGADFIASHRILFSNSQRKIYFTYASGPPFFHVEGTLSDLAASALADQFAR